MERYMINEAIKNLKIGMSLKDIYEEFKEWYEMPVIEIQKIIIKAVKLVQQGY